MDLTQYLELFLIESREHLENLNQYLLELENNPQNNMVVDEIFRAAHTLKGMAATMGYDGITELTHEMENVLSRLRNGELRADSQLIDLLLQCVDALQNMVEAIENGGNSGPSIEGLVAQLVAVGQLAAMVEPVEAEMVSIESQPAGNQMAYNSYEIALLKEAKIKGFSSFLLTVKVAPECLMKSVRAFMVFKQLEEIGEIIKSIPPAQDLEEGNFDWGFQVLLITREAPSVIAQRLSTISEITLIACEPVDVEEARRPVNEPGEAVSKADNGSDEHLLSRTGKPRQTVRVDIERLDNLMNLVGELVINKTRLEQIGLTNRLPELSETVEQFDRITTDLQSLVMKVRMVPVEQVFNRFPRMVRDLARELGKDINFQMEGKETELDRTVIDEIGEPLVHLLRNAIDHGIEKPQERRQVGKPAEGLVRLVARHEGNHVIIEVEDDGRGISLEKIRSKAVAKGLIGAKEAELLEPNAILNFIFQPGFSTADEVTDISGRGVGLDVVKTKIESLSGSIEIASVPGMGTKFKISLPLTLAIIQALLVNVGQEIYAIPLSSVDETTIVVPENIKRVQHQEVVVLRGSVLPIIRLHTLLNVPGTQELAEELYIVVVRKGDKRAGLVVDSLIGQQEIVIKSLGKLLTGIPGLAGAAILGNGEVSLILDVGSLF
ncbi:MAG: chemotaxis protein CheA [Firmicutes bacterium]|nr:chemotaxis protein CheA [Bacillota bacterium]